MVYAHIYSGKQLAVLLNLWPEYSNVPSRITMLESSSPYVTPIYKKGPKTVPANYHPDSLTSQICKLMESIIRDAIVEYLRHHKLLRTLQHGFLRAKSCLTNLLVFLEKVTDYTEQGLPVDIIFQDFHKAFDKVSHARLMAKVKAHGIDGHIWKWIDNWLRDRTQWVVVNGRKSSWKQVSSGLPQGLVLGPTLFLIYVNDINAVIDSLILKLVDHTKLYRSVLTLEHALKLQ